MRVARTALLFVAGLFFGGGVLLLLGVLEIFKEVGVEDGGGDFVVPGGPFAEVDHAAAVGAEGEVFAGGEDDFAAGGAEEGFGRGVDHGVCLYVNAGEGAPGRVRVVLVIS